MHTSRRELSTGNPWRKTVLRKSRIYGLVEIRKLKRCPGIRRMLFTKEMLDDCAIGRFRTPVQGETRRKKAKKEVSR